MTIKPVTTKPTTSNKEIKDLPDDVRGEFDPGPGPCDADKYYGVVATNQLGEVQVHPCSFCARAFLFSEEYGWLAVKKGSPLRDRINEVLQQGKDLGMFRDSIVYIG